MTWVNTYAFEWPVPGPGDCLDDVHQLAVSEVGEEGLVKFTVVCPNEHPERGCSVRGIYADIGNEIIMGTVYGPGPWRCRLKVTGYDDDSECWIVLLDDEVDMFTSATLRRNTVVSV